MKKEETAKEKDPSLVAADNLAEKGKMAFLSYTWKLNKKCDDSYDSSEINPYSDEKWANDVSCPEYDLKLAFDFYQQALPIYQEQKRYSRDMAVLYEDLGTVCDAMNDMPSALDYYYKALSLYNQLSIIGEEEDFSELLERIKDAEKKFGLHIVHEGNKCGFADKDNNIVIPCIWNDVQEFDEGLCGVKDDNQLCGFINYHGEVVIPCIYKDAYSFENGLAYVEENVDDDFPHTFYIESDGSVIASDFELKTNQIEAVYKSTIFARFGKHAEAAECILPAIGTLDPKPKRLLMLYLTLSEQYDKLIEICNKTIMYDGRSELVVIARLLLAMAYEEGKGVEQDLIQAFRYFDSVRFENNISDDDYKQVDEFLKRHPDALAPLDEDEDF